MIAVHGGCAAVIGGGPAGLMAAETLAEAGVQVALYDRMPSVGRKFLVAGKGGLNITHSEKFAQFVCRYGERQVEMTAALEAFGPEAVRGWLETLGFATFVGSSGKVFPEGMQAGPVLYAWRERLRAAGVRFQMRHRWTGWMERGALKFETPAGEVLAEPDAVVLALGGGSWGQLGSDGGWVSLLQAQGVPVTPLKPANCGFEVDWREPMLRFAGEPVKAVTLSFRPAGGDSFTQRGEFVITEHGVEGSLIYAVSRWVRDEIDRAGQAVIHLDLLPDTARLQLLKKLARPRGSRSLSEYLRRRTGIRGAKAVLLREFTPRADMDDPGKLVEALKKLPVPLARPRPLDEAISSAGGVAFEALDEGWMVRELPGVFCAGEMLDWEAPTGGYLLTGCLATGRAAGAGCARWLEKQVENRWKNSQRNQEK